MNRISRSLMLLLSCGSLILIWPRCFFSRTGPTNTGKNPLESSCPTAARRSEATSVPVTSSPAVSLALYSKVGIEVKMLRVLLHLRDRFVLLCDADDFLD